LTKLILSVKLLEPMMKKIVSGTISNQPVAARTAVALVPPASSKDLSTLRGSIERWALEHNVDVVQWVEEDSAFLTQPLDARAPLLDALVAIQSRKASLFVVPSLRRLASSHRDASIIAGLVGRSGASLRSVRTETLDHAFPAEPLPVSRMVEALESHDRLSRKIRMRVVRQDARIGNRPWGFRKSTSGKGLEPDEREMHVVQVVHSLRAEGLKIREIVNRLGEMGLSSRTGKPIGMTRVFELIQGGRKKRRAAVSLAGAA
jgi:DNA invertase Pin-like site-specific DNA recombinase